MVLLVQLLYKPLLLVFNHGFLALLLEHVLLDTQVLHQPISALINQPTPQLQHQSVSY